MGAGDRKGRPEVAAALLEDGQGLAGTGQPARVDVSAGVAGFVGQARQLVAERVDDVASPDHGGAAVARGGHVDSVLQGTRANHSQEVILFPLADGPRRTDHEQVGAGVNEAPCTLREPHLVAGDEAYGEVADLEQVCLRLCHLHEVGLSGAESVVDQELSVVAKEPLGAHSDDRVEGLAFGATLVHPHDQDHSRATGDLRQHGDEGAVELLGRNLEISRRRQAGVHRRFREHRQLRT